MTYFFRKINLVQLETVFPTKHILVLILGKNINLDDPFFFVSYGPAFVVETVPTFM